MRVSLDPLSPGKSKRNLFSIPKDQRRSQAPNPVSKPSHRSIYSSIRSPARPAGEIFIKSPPLDGALLRRSPTIIQQPVLSMEIRSQLRQYVEEVATPIEESVKEDSFLPQIESSHGAKNNCASIEDGIVSIKTSTVLKEDYD